MALQAPRERRLDMPHLPPHVIEQLEVALQDPLSLETLEDPVSLPCGHAFSRTWIIQHIEYRGRHATCPECRGVAREADLRVVPVLRRVLEVFEASREAALMYNGPARAFAVSIFPSGHEIITDVRDILAMSPEGIASLPTEDQRIQNIYRALATGIEIATGRVRLDDFAVDQAVSQLEEVPQNLLDRVKELVGRQDIRRDERTGKLAMYIFSSLKSRAETLQNQARHEAAELQIDDLREELATTEGERDEARNERAVLQQQVENQGNRILQIEFRSKITTTLGVAAVGAVTGGLGLPAALVKVKILKETAEKGIMVARYGGGAVGALCGAGAEWNWGVWDKCLDGGEAVYNKATSVYNWIMRKEV